MLRNALQGASSIVFAAGQVVANPVAKGKYGSNQSSGGGGSGGGGSGNNCCSEHLVSGRVGWLFGYGSLQIPVDE